MFRNDFQGVIVFFCQNGPAPGDGAQVCLQRNRLRLQLCQQVSVSTKKGAIHFLPHYRYKLEEHASQHHKKHLDTNRNNVCPICSQVKGLLQKMKYKYVFKGFTRPENLKKHKVRPHTFHCDFCVKSFIAVDRLERHCLNEHR